MDVPFILRNYHLVSVNFDESRSISNHSVTASLYCFQACQGLVKDWLNYFDSGNWSHKNFLAVCFSSKKLGHAGTNLFHLSGVLSVKWKI